MAKVGESSKDADPTYWGPKTDCPLYAMRFAEDLINYVWKKLELEWPEDNKVCQIMKELIQRQVFLPVVGEAVFELIGYNIELIAQTYKALLARGIQNKDDFRREACASATLYFLNGYDPAHFLIYASTIVGVSIFYFSKGNFEIADASAQIISYMLNYYIYQNAFKPTTDWFQLCLVAQDVRRAILKKELNFDFCFVPDRTIKSSTLVSHT